MENKKEVWVTAFAFITLIYFATTSSPRKEFAEQYPKIPFLPIESRTKKIVKTSRDAYINPEIQKMDDVRKLKRKIRTIQKKIDADTKTLKTVAKTAEYKQRLKNSIVENRKLVVQYHRRLKEVQPVKK